MFSIAESQKYMYSYDLHETSSERILGRYSNGTRRMAEAGTLAMVSIVISFQRVYFRKRSIVTVTKETSN